MPLPILQSHGDPTDDDLLRFFARTELHWSRHVAEETSLNCGVAFTNASLPGVFEANRMMDVSLADGETPQQALAEVERHYSDAGSGCGAWLMNPAAPPQRTRPMIDHLISLGYLPKASDVMYLRAFPTETLREVDQLKIIPARASFRHARALFEESAAAQGTPALADANMLHLDDSHTDALIAIRDGVAAAFMAVLSAGEIGTIQDLFVAAQFRGQGIGRTMMSRALEICARSLFKHVSVGVAPGNSAAISLFERCGFRKIGQTVSYRVPGKPESKGQI